MAEPLPICYLNGTYLPLGDARISPLDRGFLFADSVYEVLPVFGGRPFRFREHFDRLLRSLQEVRMESPHTHAEWLQILEGLVARNSGQELYIYVQVTRGSEFGRNHAFPQPAVAPTVFAMASPLPPLTDRIREQGISAITAEDFRWGRCDIKSTALLANVLLKQAASDAGAAEAILIRDDHVMEGSSTTVFVVLNDILVTPPNSRWILPGTTREVVLELAQGLLPVDIRPITVSQLRGAGEIWLAAATRDTLPVTRLDGVPVADGRPGRWWRLMCDRFATLKAALANQPAL